MSAKSQCIENDQNTFAAAEQARGRARGSALSVPHTNVLLFASGQADKKEKKNDGKTKGDISK
jgi:predicted NBD/HSP70 family sugar kinase